MSKKKPSKALLDLDDLKSRLSGACEGLDHEIRKIFACDAFFRGGSVFGLIWKTGRVALKIPVDLPRVELSNLPGAGPWRVGSKTMKEWVLIPERFHKSRSTLRHWTLIAFALVLVVR